MSCRKKTFGRFAPIQMESDNCRKGAEYVPIWKKDFTVSPCLDVCIEECSSGPFNNPCDDVTPCHNFDCEKDSKKVASCVLGCSSSCGKPCKHAAPCYDNGCKAVDACKPIHLCGGKLTGRFPVIQGLCSKPDYENNPCSYLRPCHDIFKKIRSDCRGLQPCEKEATGRFPFFKVNADGACCKPAYEHCCFN